MPTNNPKADNTNADKRLFFVSVGIFTLVSIFALYTVIRRNASAPERTAVATMPSGLMATSTQVAAPVPVAGDLMEQVKKVAQMVTACPDYNDARRTQMREHIQWLLAPDTIPSFMKLPLGSDPNGRLIQGMATFTLAEWGQHSKATTSCLLPIGKQLNQMLVATGQEPFPDFQ